MFGYKNVSDFNLSFGISWSLGFLFFVNSNDFSESFSSLNINIIYEIEFLYVYSEILYD